MASLDGELMSLRPEGSSSPLVLPPVCFLQASVVDVVLPGVRTQSEWSWDTCCPCRMLGTDTKTRRWHLLAPVPFPPQPRGDWGRGQWPQAAENPENWGRHNQKSAKVVFGPWKPSHSPFADTREPSGKLMSGQVPKGVHNRTTAGRYSFFSNI